MELDARERRLLEAARRDPRQQLGPYLLLEELGRGGMGVVHKGYDPRMHRRVAIKLLLDPNAHVLIERFKVEARLSSRIQHPNMAQVYELNVADPNAPFLVLQFVPGQTLRSRLKQGGALPPPVIARYVAQVADAIHAAHAVGVLHRDLKPANVMITPDDQAVVLDFGLAKSVADPHGLTKTGELVGTINYMAPELATETDAVGTPVDIYGLGAILYECLTGQPPYVGNSPVNVLSALIHRPPHAPSEVVPEPVDPALEAIALRCLERDPAARFPDAAAVASALRDLAQVELPAPRSRLAPLLVVGVGGLTLLGGGALLLAGRPGPQPAPATSSAAASPSAVLTRAVATAPTPAATPTVTASPSPTPTSSLSPADQARAALKELRSAVAETDRQPMTAAGAQAARAGQRRVEAALRDLDAAVARQPDDPYVQVLRARGTLEAFRLEEALAQAAAILARHPRRHGARHVYVQAAAERDVLLTNTPGALRHALRAERGRARKLARNLHRPPLGTRVCVLLLQGKAEQAQQAAAAAPGPDGDYWRALTRWRRGSPNPEQVGPHVEAALRAAPRHRRAALAAGLLAVRAVDERQLRTHLARTGVHPRNAFLLVQFALRRRSDPASLEKVQEARRYLPRAALIPFALAKLRASTDPRARELLDEALRRDPRFVPAWIARAQLRSLRDDPAGAAEDYRAAVALEPLYSYRVALAKALTASGERAQARAELEAIRHGTNTSVLIARGLAFTELDPARALADFDLALALVERRRGRYSDQTEASIRAGRAGAYLAQGNLEKAEQDLQAAFRLAGTKPPLCFLVRGRLRRKQGRHREAARDLRTYLARNRDPKRAAALRAYLAEHR